MSLIYLARPIDHSVAARADLAHREVIVSTILTESGAAVYRPAQAWRLGRNSDREDWPAVEQLNRDALERCDALVALLPGDVPSIGVPREIEAAVAVGTPVAVLTDRTDSVALSDVEVIPADQDERAWEGLLRKWVAGLGSSGRAWQMSVTLGPGAVLPTRHYAGDAGFDLATSVDSILQPHSHTDLSTGVRVALPPGIWLRLTGRSSSLRRHGLLVTEGIIDTGYRGELFVGAWNLTPEEVRLPAGTRIGQAIPSMNLAGSLAVRQVAPDQFERIPHDGRAGNGFGSTG